MRFAAQRAQNELDWSILDVEPEEWERRMADLRGCRGEWISSFYGGASSNERPAG